MRCSAQARPSQRSSTLASIRTLLVLTASHHDLFQNVDAFRFRNALEISKMSEVEGPLLGGKKRNIGTARKSDWVEPSVRGPQNLAGCALRVGGLESRATSATSCNSFQFTVLLPESLCSESLSWWLNN
jgi:hypothetical protein